MVQAAQHRGLSFNAFMRLAAVATAKRVLEAPADQLLDAFIDPDSVKSQLGS